MRHTIFFGEDGTVYVAYVSRAGGVCHSWWMIPGTWLED